jgi:hypothetical protein
MSSRRDWPKPREAADRVIQLDEVWGKNEKSAEWWAKLTRVSDSTRVFTVGDSLMLVKDAAHPQRLPRHWVASQSRRDCILVVSSFDRARGIATWTRAV